MRRREKRGIAAAFALSAAMWCACETRGGSADAPVRINDHEFRDKVYACWLGKNIGGTLGMPVEGRREVNSIDFYTNLKDGEAAPNDDLDLQMLWLKAMEEHDGSVDARILGEYWVAYVCVDWNEYGVGKANVRRGILPPLSGEFENARWKHSNGAWVRSEIWACLAPGSPAVAAQFAREDACVDHGVAEGTLAEIFTAAIQSAAFVEGDRDKLIAIGLAMIPEESRLARAVRTVVAAKNAGKDWQAAREDAIKASEDTGWFQAPRDVAFMLIGWLYGDGDFGKSLCLAVNCGDDTDSTGATLGGIFGILYGTKGIPARWSRPIGTAIKTIAVSGFTCPKDLDEFTDRTVAMTRKVQAQRNLPVALTSGPTDLDRAGELALGVDGNVRRLWHCSPYRIVRREDDLEATLDYVVDPVIFPGNARAVTVALKLLGAASAWRPLTAEVGTNAYDNDPEFVAVRIAVVDVPAGWRVSGVPANAVPVRRASGLAETRVSIAFTAEAPEFETHRMAIEVSGGAKKIRLPVTLVGLLPAADNVALASNGATASSDGEYANEPGCTAEVIDGVVATPADFSNRWHSSLETTHPHWIQVKLARPESIVRIVIRSADPDGYPVSFQGLIVHPGATELTEIFSRTDNRDSARVGMVLAQAVTTDTFRLVIRASANPKWPNAAQISEIEMYRAPR